MGKTRTARANFTRPNDTTQYAAGDAVANSTSAPSVMIFEDCAQYIGGGGVILSALLEDSANQATKGEFEVWIYDTAPTADNDNEAFTPTDAENRNLVAVLEFDTQVFVGDATSGAGGNCVYKLTNKESFGFNCEAAYKRLYGKMVARNTYTPVAQERFDITLQILLDD